jgi:hypothetical protein
MVCRSLCCNSSATVRGRCQSIDCLKCGGLAYVSFPPPHKLSGSFFLLRSVRARVLINAVSIPSKYLALLMLVLALM